MHSIPNSKPVEKLIDDAVRDFELNIKRRYPTTEDNELDEDDGNGTWPLAYVNIPGLARKEEKGFVVGGDMAIYR